MDFELFTPECGFTDDTVCTVAVADALMRGADFGQALHSWCRRYPYPTGGVGAGRPRARPQRAAQARTYFASNGKVSSFHRKQRAR